jgi:hypothetical protein
MFEYAWPRRLSRRWDRGCSTKPLRKYLTASVFSFFFNKNAAKLMTTFSEPGSNEKAVSNNVLALASFPVSEKQIPASTKSIEEPDCFRTKASENFAAFRKSRDSIIASSLLS